MTASDCIFCKIAAGDIPSELVHVGDSVVAFRDINPQAPVHILVIPRKHVASLDQTGREDQALLGSLLLAARDIARKEGLAERGYRAVLNIGEDGGQSVHHVHLHLLGGRPLSWPPG